MESVANIPSPSPMSAVNGISSASTGISTASTSSRSDIAIALLLGLFGVLLIYVIYRLRNLTTTVKNIKDEVPNMMHDMIADWFAEPRNIQYVTRMLARPANNSRSIRPVSICTPQESSRDSSIRRQPPKPQDQANASMFDTFAQMPAMFRQVLSGNMPPGVVGVTIGNAYDSTCDTDENDEKKDNNSSIVEIEDVVSDDNNESNNQCALDNYSGCLESESVESESVETDETETETIGENTNTENDDDTPITDGESDSVVVVEETTAPKRKYKKRQK